MDHKRNSKDRDRKHKSTGENKGTTKTKGYKKSFLVHTPFNEFS